MKRILFFVLALGSIVCACSGNSNELHNETETVEKDKLDSGVVQCPHGHTDSIIPIVYGYPSEEDFQKSDLGLVALGGCELPENPEPWFCKIHHLAF